MVEFIPGDQVVCRILDGEIVGNKTKSHDREENFLIVAVDYDDNYIIYVPDNIYVKDTIEVVSHNFNRLAIPERYLGNQVAYIGDRQVVRLHYRSDGITCERCKEHFQYAEANTGTKYLCYLCRGNPYR